MQKKELYVVPVPVLDTYALTVCALLTALSVVLARLLTIIPSEVSRFSLEAVPNSPGRTAVRAAARRRGGLCRRLYRLPVFPLWLQPDLLPAAHSVRPVGGLVRRYVWRRPTLWRAALAVFPAAVCGSVLWQSMALALVYGGAAKWPYFLTRLAARSVQFAITGCIDALLVWLLMRRNALSPVLRRIKTKGGDSHDAG